MQGCDRVHNFMSKVFEEEYNGGFLLKNILPRGRFTRLSLEAVSRKPRFLPFDLYRKSERRCYQRELKSFESNLSSLFSRN